MSLSQTLSWVDGGGSTSFNVWFNGAFIGNQAGTSITQSGLLNSTTYTWRIDSVNACGTTKGDTWVFTTKPLNALATDWSNRVVINGGAVPSDATILAISDFSDALDAAGITSKMIAVNCFAPDSLTATITPLIVGPGNDPWINHNNAFLAGDLTVDGLKGDGAAKFLDTGLLVSSAFSDDISAGITLYNTFADNTAGKLDAGVQWGGIPFVEFSLYVSHASGSSYFACWDENTGQVTGALPSNPFIGYVSGNRTAVNAAAIYAASSVYPHASIGTLATTGSSRTTMTQPVLVFNQNTSTGPAAGFSLKRFSFAAIHLGLTAADSLALYNAVQALRTALGGGYV